MPDDRPPEPKSQIELILDRIEAFAAKIDKNDLVKALRIALRLTKIAFRFVPMSKDQKELFVEITNAVEEGLNAM